MRHGAVNCEAAGFPKGAIYGYACCVASFQLIVVACSGHEVPLSNKGEAEAEAAAKYLREEHVDRIFSSPLSRAQFGANCIARGRGITVQCNDGFREVDRGHWCGLTWEQIDAKFPGEREQHDNDLEWKGHGGETFREVRSRVLAAKDQHLLQGGTTVLVSHNWVTKAVVADAMGLDIQDWGQIDIPTASVSLLEYDADGHVTVKYAGA